MNITKKEMKILIQSLMDRERSMFEQYQIFKDLGNIEAQLACLNEWKLSPLSLEAGTTQERTFIV